MKRYLSLNMRCCRFLLLYVCSSSTMGFTAVRLQLQRGSFSTLRSTILARSAIPRSKRTGAVTIATTTSRLSTTCASLNRLQQYNLLSSLNARLYSSSQFLQRQEHNPETSSLESGNLSIVSYPHPALRNPNDEIVLPDELPIVRSLAKMMLKIMYNDDGVGLAAPQVGVNKRLMVYNPTGDENQWLEES